MKEFKVEMRGFYNYSSIESYLTDLSEDRWRIINVQIDDGVSKASYYPYYVTTVAERDQQEGSSDFVNAESQF